MRRLSLKSHDLTECFAANLKHAQRFEFLLSKVRDQFITINSFLSFLAFTSCISFSFFYTRFSCRLLSPCYKTGEIGWDRPACLFHKRLPGFSIEQFANAISKMANLWVNKDSIAAHEFLFLFDKILWLKKNYYCRKIGNLLEINLPANALFFWSFSHLPWFQSRKGFPGWAKMYVKRIPQKNRPSHSLSSLFFAFFLSPLFPILLPLFPYFSFFSPSFQSSFHLSLALLFCYRSLGHV